MTYIELAQSIWLGITEDQASTVLWNCTAFPFDSVEGTTLALMEAYKASGGDVSIALAQADDALFAGMEAAKAKEATT